MKREREEQEGGMQGTKERKDVWMDGNWWWRITRAVICGYSSQDHSCHNHLHQFPKTMNSSFLDDYKLIEKMGEEYGHN